VSVSPEPRRLPPDPRPSWADRRRGDGDPAEQVARVAQAKHDLLLRVHRHRLRREDLEDCFSQATLELVADVRNGGTYASRLHLARVLEQRFVSRVRDRRRALGGRSPMQAALERARPLGCAGDPEIDVIDPTSGLEEIVALRGELARIAAAASRLTADQRLALAAQLGSATDPSDFCARQGWTLEKYRKVLQRARSRLRSLLLDRDVTSA
jgi:DNA-directed RNA polymerase specialized sigma24 family protein